MCTGFCIQTIVLCLWKLRTLQDLMFGCMGTHTHRFSFVIRVRHRET